MPKQRTCLRCGSAEATVKHTFSPSIDEHGQSDPHGTWRTEWWCEPCTYRAMGITTATLNDPHFAAWEQKLKDAGATWERVP